MKNVIMIIISAIVGGLMLLMGMTICGRTNRSMEVTGSLSASVEKTIDNLALEKKYDISDMNEYVADMVQSLSDALDADAEVSVEVTGMDKEKRILGLKITVTYRHPNGNIGTLTYDKTVVLDGKEAEAPAEAYTVSFYLSKEDMLSGENCYKSSQVLSGDVATVPALPSGTTGWKDANDYIADFTVPVTEGRLYYAY